MKMGSIQDYRIVGELGRGGFATVFKAVNVRTKHVVAIKRIDKLRVEEKSMQRKVRDEAEIHFRLEHDHILKLYTFFEDKQFIYHVLEYCAHGDLQSYLQRQPLKKVTEAEACTVFKQVLSGILYLQKNKILHRDLKLANILLTEDNIVKIADFGLSTQLSHPREMHKTMCGTPNFMSPEVAIETPYGLEVDVWGLGVVLYTLLKGLGSPEPPNGFSTATLMQIPTVSPEAADLLRKLLEKDPLRRISAREIAAEPFLRKYPSMPLRGGKHDSGLGPCSLCDNISKVSSISSFRSRGKTSRVSGNSSIHVGSAYLYNGKQQSHLTDDSKQRCEFNKPLKFSDTGQSQVGLFGSSFIESEYSNGVPGFNDTSGFVDGDLGKSDICQPFRSSARVGEDYITPITTDRLPAKEIVFEDGTYSITKCGCAVWESPLRKGVGRFYLVVKDNYVYFFPSRKSSGGLPRIPDNALSYPYSSLPSKFRAIYRRLAEFVQSVKRKTYKITIEDDCGTIIAMESFPEDFEITFKTGEIFSKKGNVVIVTDREQCQSRYKFDYMKDRTQTFGLDSHLVERFLEQYEQCIELEKTLHKLRGEKAFPLFMGRMKC